MNADQRTGYFGNYGGSFVAETLIQPLVELEKAYSEASQDATFQKTLSHLLAQYVGRPTPLYFAEGWTKKIGGAKIFLKREDLNHTGAHKVNNTVGQILLAKRMGKTRLIAETGAGQHGVASATVAAKMGIECVVYMGAVDTVRQQTNVYRMKMLGASVVEVHSGTQTLKDALNDALRDWVQNVDNTFYVIGTAAGPHPYPTMVRDFQKVIGEEVKKQCQAQLNQLPDALVACVGGGSNAIGLFHPFIKDAGVAMYGVEAGGIGLDTGQHAAPLNVGKPGVLHGNRTYLMMDDDGQISGTHSISAGLDYPGVGPEHAFLKDQGRVEYVAANDDETLEAFHELALVEGIIPALESAHALAYAKKLAAKMRKDQNIVVSLSGRGDKDLQSVMQADERRSNHEPN